MDAGRRPETPGPKTKDFITFYTQSNMRFMFMSFPLALLQSQRGDRVAHVDTTHTVGFQHSWRTPVFYNGQPNFELAQLCPRGRHCLYYKVQKTKLPSAPEGRYYLYLPRLFNIKIPLKRQSQQKAADAFAWRHAETWKTQGEQSPHSVHPRALFLVHPQHSEPEPRLKYLDRDPLCSPS